LQTPLLSDQSPTQWAVAKACKHTVFEVFLEGLCQLCTESDFTTTPWPGGKMRMANRRRG